jgi:hypothetical protein
MMGGGGIRRQTHTPEYGDLVSQLSCFQNKESRPKKYKNYVTGTELLWLSVEHALSRDRSWSNLNSFSSTGTELLVSAESLCVRLRFSTSWPIYPLLSELSSFLSVFDHIVTDLKSTNFGLSVNNSFKAIRFTRWSCDCGATERRILGNEAYFEVVILSVKHSTEVIKNHTVQYRNTIWLVISVFNRINKTACLEVMFPSMYMFTADFSSLAGFDFLTALVLNIPVLSGCNVISKKMNFYHSLEFLWKWRAVTLFNTIELRMYV